jgi:excisionase family DNA binding protein
MLRKHHRTIQRWAQKGLLPGAYKAGRSWRIPRSALARAKLDARRYDEYLLAELRAARHAIESAPPDLSQSVGVRAIEQELLRLHEANRRLGRALQEAARRRRRHLT